jgi:dCTP deaminase
MILSDTSIRELMKKGGIKITPCDLERQLGSMGVDLRLSNEFKTFKTTHRPYIDLQKENIETDTEDVTIKEGESFVLHPGEFMLGCTVEHIELPNNIAARLDGRSSLGRIGIIVHSTAGHIDPGWKGRLTLEISNIGKLPISLSPGIRFCHIIFEELTSPVGKTYKGKYLGSRGPVASRINEELSD